MNNGLQVLSVSLDICNAISFFSDWLQVLVGEREGGGVNLLLRSAEGVIMYC